MSAKSTDLPVEVRKYQQAVIQESAKRSEMPWHAFSTLNDTEITGVPERTNLSSIGQKIHVKLNMWKINMNLSKNVEIYQYDVKLMDQSRAPITMRKMLQRAWEGPTVQSKLKQEGRFLYDGNAIAFGLTKEAGGIRIPLDLNVEEGRKPSAPGSKNHVFFEMSYTRSLKTDNLRDMLQGTDHGGKAINWGEILNALEHVLHQQPARTMIIKNKQFYTKNQVAVQKNTGDRQEIAEGLLAVRGTYVSFKPVFMGYNGNKMVRQLALNVDVANSAFWIPGKLIELLPKFFGRMPAIADVARDMATARRAQGDHAQQKAFYNTQFGRFMQKLRRVRCTFLHLAKQKNDKGESLPPSEKGIMDFLPKTPKEVFFKDDNGKQKSVFQYFQEKYNIKCQDWPIVQFGAGEKTIYVPLEVLSIAPDQKYNFKLNEKQTSDMLFFAVKAPGERWANIRTAVAAMDWENDPWIKAYGMSVTPVDAPIAVDNARLLPTPNVVFSNGSHPAKVTVTGRWRLDGKVFKFPNEVIISAYGFAIHKGRNDRYPPKRDEVLRFAKDFGRIYTGHGGRYANNVAAQNPFIWEGDCTDPNALKQFGQGIIQHCKDWSGGRARPMLCFFVVPNRNVDVYNAVKQACDLRWGAASQVMLNKHVQKCQPQYISNICLKVNAKLGGSTCVASQHPASQGLIKEPTAIIGADVTHGGPGVNVDSIAAMTMSRDTQFTKYMGMVAANGTRQEIIQTGPIEDMITRMIKPWCTALKTFPKNIIYMRDGVSNQQFYKIVTEEVRDIKKALSKYLHSIGKPNLSLPKFTVLCATKRHHVRLFPLQAKDQNSNPLPGTLVETGCTLATGVDFFLNSHVAIKGTARPVHYVVLQNECGFKIESLQQFVLEHCFQYVRSTTPISQHPAIYYAHLAAARGVQHVKATESSGKGPADTASTDVLKIHPLHPLNEELTKQMWFV